MRQWTDLGWIDGYIQVLARAQQSSYCFSVCWWPRPLITQRAPSVPINCSDEMKSLCSSPSNPSPPLSTPPPSFPKKKKKRPGKICRTVFWQAVTLNHCFMTAGENAVHVPAADLCSLGSGEYDNLASEQMDRGMPQGAPLSHAFSPTATQMESTCGEPLLLIRLVFVSERLCSLRPRLMARH